MAFKTLSVIGGTILTNSVVRLVLRKNTFWYKVYNIWRMVRSNGTRIHDDENSLDRYYDDLVHNAIYGRFFGQEVNQANSNPDNLTTNCFCEEIPIAKEQAPKSN